MSEMPQEKPSRMTLSRVVEMLLEKREHGTSSVTLSRNAKGDVQIEVVVRTSEGGPVSTIEEAEAAARRTFESLRASYPMGTGFVGRAPTGKGSSEPTEPAPSDPAPAPSGEGEGS